LVPREKSPKSCSFYQSCCIKMPNFVNRSKLTENLLSFYLALSFAKVKVQPKNLMKFISQTSETWDFRFRVFRYLIFAVKSVGFQITHYSLLTHLPRPVMTNKAIKILPVLHDIYMFFAGRQFFVCLQFMAVTIASAN
jgi:hypothetical protein